MKVLPLNIVPLRLLPAGTVITDVTLVDAYLASEGFSLLIAMDAVRATMRQRGLTAANPLKTNTAPGVFGQSSGLDVIRAGHGDHAYNNGKPCWWPDNSALPVIITEDKRSQLFTNSGDCFTGRIDGRDPMTSGDKGTTMRNCILENLRRRPPQPPRLQFDLFKNGSVLGPLGDIVPDEVLDDGINTWIFMVGKGTASGRAEISLPAGMLKGLGLTNFERSPVNAWLVRLILPTHGMLFQPQLPLGADNPFGESPAVELDIGG